MGLAIAVTTLCGGFLASRYRTAYTLLLDFSDGAVLGVALFDLPPEAVETGAAILGAIGIVLCLAAGFATYLVLDRAGSRLTGAAAGYRGHLAAASLMDGLGIGFGFQISESVVAVVAAAMGLPMRPLESHNRDAGMSFARILFDRPKATEIWPSKPPALVAVAVVGTAPVATVARNPTALPCPAEKACPGWRD